MIIFVMIQILRLGFQAKEFSTKNLKKGIVNLLSTKKRNAQNCHSRCGGNHDEIGHFSVIDWIRRLIGPEATCRNCRSRCGGNHDEISHFSVIDQLTSEAICPRSAGGAANGKRSIEISAGNHYKRYMRYAERRRARTLNTAIFRRNFLELFMTAILTAIMTNSLDNFMLFFNVVSIACGVLLRSVWVPPQARLYCNSIRINGKRILSRRNRSIMPLRAGGVARALPKTQKRACTDDGAHLSKAQMVVNQNGSATVKYTYPFSAFVECPLCEAHKVKRQTRLPHLMVLHLMNRHGIGANIKHSYTCRFCSFSHEQASPAIATIQSHFNRCPIRCGILGKRPAKAPDPKVGRFDSNAVGAELWKTKGLEAWLYDNTISAIATMLSFVSSQQHLLVVCSTYWASSNRRDKKQPEAIIGDADWQYAIVPVFGNSPNHWSFAWFDRAKATCFFYDSFHSKATADTVAGLNEIWAKFESRKSLQRVVHPNHSKIEKQVDGFNCGIYVCCLIEQLVTDPTAVDRLEVRHADLAVQRAKWARQVCPEGAPPDPSDRPTKRARRSEPPTRAAPVEAPTVAMESQTARAQPKLPNPINNAHIESINEWSSRDDQQWHQFEEIVGRFLARIESDEEPMPVDNRPTQRDATTQTYRKIERPIVEKCHRFDKREASIIQRLYLKSKKSAIARILGQKTARCSVEPRQVEQYFSEIMNNIPPNCIELESNLPRLDRIDAESASSISAPISAREVVAALSMASNTAPGEDKLKYSDLRKRDPSGSVLAAIFSTCLAHSKVPSSWKRSSTTLIHKKGDQADLGNWRPISIMLTAYKLFTSILARRLNKVISEKKVAEAPDLVTSEEQLGFEATEGCSEHIHELQTCLQHAYRNKKSITVCFLDLSNAFGSVPHELIMMMLDKLGFDSKFRLLVSDFYTGATMSVKTAETETNPIPIKSGVKQGDPLSPTLFCIALEYMLRNVRQRYPLFGYSWGDMTRTHLLAYADDLAIVCRNEYEMKTTLETLSRLANICRLNFKPSKCATLTLKKGEPAPTVFQVQGKEMPSMAKGETYSYLGTPVGVGVDKSAVHQEVLNKASADLVKIRDSALSDWQKLDAMKTFIVSRLYYRMANSDIPHEDLKPLDDLLRFSAKSTLHLPKHAANEFIHLPSALGGAGLLPLNVLEMIISLAHGFKLLTSKRRLTRRIALAGLRTVVRGKMLGPNPDDSDVELYLNGISEGMSKVPDSYHSGSIFPRMRRAMIYLRSKADVQLRFVDDHLTFVCDDGKTTIGFANRHLIQRTIRRQLYPSLQKSLTDHVCQGSTYEMTLKDRASYQFLSDFRYISFGAFRWIHAARMLLVKLNSYSHIADRDRKCRRCDHPTETLLHVLNQCRYQMSTRITARHNAVQDLFVDTIKRCVKRSYQIAVNRKCDVTGANLRPDILIRDEKEKRMFIIDVTCPYEQNDEAFYEARVRKITKYAPIEDHYKSQGYTVFNDALIVGSLGAWDPRNDDLLREVGLSLRNSRTMKRRLVGTCIEHSKTIYWAHIIGDRFQDRSIKGGGTPTCVTVPPQGEQRLLVVDDQTTTTTTCQRTRSSSKRIRLPKKRNYQTSARPAPAIGIEHLIGHLQMNSVIFTPPIRSDSSQPASSRTAQRESVRSYPLIP